MLLGKPCEVSCGGFSSLRPECVQDACLANNLCDLVVSAADRDAGQTCAEWCCVSHSGASVLMILFCCLGVFSIIAGCYYANLHTKDQIEEKKHAMNQAIDAATTGPSSLLTGARERLSQFRSEARSAASSAAVELATMGK